MTKKELKEVCANMDAAATIEYCKGLGLTVKTEKAHRIIYDGDEKIGAVESIQGIKADGTERGMRTPSVKSLFDLAGEASGKIYDKLRDEATDEETKKVIDFMTKAQKELKKVDEIFSAINARIAEKAKAAAQKERNRKRAAAATEKLKDSSADEKLAYLQETAAALGIDLKKLLSMQTAAAV